MPKRYTGKDIEQIMLLAQNVLSLNTPIGKNNLDYDNDTELGDIIPDPSPEPPEESMLADRRVFLAKYLKKYLTERERRILIMRFGFLEKAKTLEQIGEEFNLTRERVRQIEVKAIKKLRRAFAAHHITWENI